MPRSHILRRLISGSANVHREQAPPAGARQTHGPTIPDGDRLRIAMAVFDSVAEGVLISDARKHIIAVNPAFTRTTGWTLEDLRGKHLSVLRSDHHPPAFYRQIDEALQRDGHWTGEFWDRHKDGTTNAKKLSITAVADDHDEATHYVALLTDTSAQKRAERELNRLAQTDALTALPNRALFKDRLDMELRRARRRRKSCGLMVLDLDHFKHINDTMGHRAGDIVLRAVSGRLVDCVRNEDTVARLSGDEFTVILGGLADIADAEEVAQRIVRSLSRPISCQGHDLTVTASIGIALFPQDADDVDALLSHAGKAMHDVKQSGRAGYRFYSDEMDRKAADGLRMEAELRRALAEDELELFFQPRYDLMRRAVRGAEALVRWRHRERGLVPPDAFIAVAEESGLIVPLGRFVLREACIQARPWFASGLIDGTISVNLSSRQLKDPGLVDDIRSILQVTGMPPENLELELTESLVMDDAEASIGRLRELRGMGLSIAIDDFGTGHSSLAYLKQLPVQAVKIDRAFVRDIDRDKDDATIVSAIIGLAHGLDLHVVAEGVETLEQAIFLTQQGCQELQGYYISPPVPAKDFPGAIARVTGFAEAFFGSDDRYPPAYAQAIERAS